MGDGAGHADRQLARDLAYRAVAARERTVAELRSLLERKRAEPGAIETAVAELTDAGYLDDARYARRFADDKRSLERWGAERIERELARRGVAAEHVEAAVSGREPEEELEVALALLDQRFSPPLDDPRQCDRAWRFLVRRGYHPDLAYDAVRRRG